MPLVGGWVDGCHFMRELIACSRCDVTPTVSLACESAPPSPSVVWRDAHSPHSMSVRTSLTGACLLWAQGGDRYQHAPMGLPFDWHLKPQAPDLWRPASPRSSQDDAADAGGRHDQQYGGQEEAVRSNTHPAGLRCTPADVRVGCFPSFPLSRAVHPPSSPHRWSAPSMQVVRLALLALCAAT